TPPSIVCPADQTESLTANCTFVVPNYTTSATATDNCGSVTVTQSPAAGTVLTGAGTRTITLTATDGTGNTSTCSFALIVRDNTAPTVVCQPFTLQLPVSGTGNIAAANIDNGSSDNCGITSLTLDRTTFTCADAGTQTVILTATDAAGNSASCTAIVTVQPPAASTIAGNLAICVGDATTLTASGGSGYTWNTGATTAAITVAPTTTTTYTVTSTAGGCNGAASVTVTVNPLPAAPTIAGAPVTVCAGTSTTLTASGGVGYTWNTGTTTAAISVAPTSTTTYAVSVTDANGCRSASTTAVVSVNPLPQVSISGSLTISAGASTTLSATGTAGVSYVWNTGATSSSIVVAPTITTTYTVTATDANGCQAQAAAVVRLGGGAVAALPLAPRGLIATGLDTATIRLDWVDLADNETGYWVYRGSVTDRFLTRIATLPAGTGPMEYIDNNNLSVDTRYAYQVIAIGVGGNAPSNVANGATFPRAPRLASVRNGCAGGVATIAVTGDQASERFFWYTDSTLTQRIKDFDGTDYDKATLDVRQMTAGSYTYYVTAVGVVYESKPRLAVPVRFEALPMAAIEEAAGRDLLRICEEAVTLTAAEVSGATYAWTVNGNAIGTGRTITGTQGGEYRVTITRNGCATTSEPLRVILNFLPTVRLTVPDNVRFCEAGEIGVQEIAGAIYGWTRDGVNRGITTPNLTVTESGVYRAIVSLDGCPAQSVAVNVTVDKAANVPALALTATQTELCLNEQTTLSATPIAGARYRWFLDGRLLRSTDVPSITTGAPGRYAVSVTLDGACGTEITSDALTITGLPAPPARLERVGDEQLAIVIPANDPIQTIRWFFNGEETTPLANQQTITPSEEGTYLAFVTYQTGCTVFTNGFRFFRRNEGGLPTGTEADELSLQLYPNPTDGAFEVRLPTREAGTLSIFDVLGQRLESRTFEAATDALRFHIGGYPAGTYLLRIETPTGMWVRKVVRQ
ncbi:MAG: T9SS type A sorting domain-containing protein, partial [Bernardetiaceae bacterium]